MADAHEDRFRSSTASGAEASAVLQTAFLAMCRLYFPRWKACATWTIREGARGSWEDAQGQPHTTREFGYCDAATRTIWITSAQDKATMIHEVCHAVTGAGHGKRFLTRLQTAATQAQLLREPTLAVALRTEVEQYTQSPQVTARTVYGRIEDILCDVPGVTFNQVVESLAYDYAWTPSELLADYPRARAVYETIRHHEIAMLRHQLQVMQAAGVLAAMMTSTTERLRLMESVTE